MSLNQIQLGVPTTILQNIVYGLPARRCLLFTDATTPTIKIANNVGISPSVTVTLDSNGEASLAAAFIQCTSGNISICVKAL